MSNHTEEVLNEIVAELLPCQKFWQGHVRFKTTLPPEENLNFREDIFVDLIFLEGKTVLHVVNTANYFSVATFFHTHGASFRHNIDGVWLAFVMTSCFACTVYPNRLQSDQECVFTSEGWKKVTTLN